MWGGVRLKAGIGFASAFHIVAARAARRDFYLGFLHSAARAALVCIFLAASTPAAYAALLPTTTIVTSDINSSGLGQSVTFTATVTGLVVQPSGTVTSWRTARPSAAAS